MPYFIKTETIRHEYLNDLNFRKKIIKEHISWVKDLKSIGFEIKSGFLVNEKRKPGGGGLLVIKCKSFEEARKILKEDPMIKNDIVNWIIHEWIDVN